MTNVENREFSVNEAYVAGLLVAGGTVTASSFEIVLPLKKWGALPNNGGQLNTAILNVVRPKIKDALGVDVSYHVNASNGNYTLAPISPLTGKESTKLRQLLADLGFPIMGTLIETANLEVARENLGGGHVAKEFLSGVFDCRASVEKSHRKFNDSAPIVSIEIPGRTSNFAFVVQLCNWMTSFGSKTDQILFNHPSFHAGEDPSYTNWKKGFKLRIRVSEFSHAHYFGMDPFANAVRELAKNQPARLEVSPCALRDFDFKDTSIHPGIFDPSLPVEVRGKVFLHFYQACLAMGCEYAPKESVLKKTLAAAPKISVLPTIQKGTKNEMDIALAGLIEEHMSGVDLEESTATVIDALSRLCDYTKARKAIAYLFGDLHGKRVIGAQETVLQTYADSTIGIIRVKDMSDSPTLIFNVSNGRAALVSVTDGPFNQKLVGGNVQVANGEIKVSSHG